MNKAKVTKKDIAAAFKTSMPIMVTFIILGMGFGILMQKHGYGPVWSLISEILIFSGTVQFVSISFMEGGSFIMAAITALMVSARHSFFSISMISRYRKEGKKKWYLFYALCDETYAMLSRDDSPEGVNKSAYRVLVTLFDQISWLLGSVLGGVAGNLLDFDSTGIDFSMTALFTTVFIQQWIDSKCHIPAVLGLSATLISRLIFGRKEKVPEFILYLGKVVPYTAMGLLIVYCLKDVSVFKGNHALPEIIALSIISSSYLWKRSAIFSVTVGTVVYMILVQMVF